MKMLALALCAAGLLSVAAAAQEVTAPITQMLKAFNSGDVKAIAAVYVSGEVSITDEVPPFHWSGANANDSWLADLAKAEKAAGMTETKVGFSSALRTEIDGDTAYVVVPTTYSWKQAGKAMTENATMTFVLHKDVGAWKVASWTWSGHHPHSAK
ncbi:MAG TPA: nuclear transport factor 2 family protein [Candidatus Koribacter sp.]|jgi:ketosteroid isomerase-like protein